MNSVRRIEKIWAYTAMGSIYSGMVCWWSDACRVYRVWFTWRGQKIWFPQSGNPSPDLLLTKSHWYVRTICLYTKRRKILEKNSASWLSRPWWQEVWRGFGPSARNCSRLEDYKPEFVLSARETSWTSETHVESSWNQGILIEEVYPLKLLNIVMLRRCCRICSSISSCKIL